MSGNGVENLKQATLELLGQTAVITLDNGPQNRLSIEMLAQLDTLLHSVEHSNARALIVRAEGPDFSFGGDIVPWVDMSSAELQHLFEQYMRTFNRFERLAIPTVVAAQGKCFGGGFELALRADILFASDGTTFGHPEQSLAIVTILGGIYRVAERAGRAKAMEWAMTSEPVSVQEMHQRGVVNRISAADRLWTDAKAFADKVANGPTRAHAAHKALLHIWANGGIAAADQAMFDIAMPLFESDDVRTALPASVKAFLEEKPRPDFHFVGR